MAEMSKGADWDKDTSLTRACLTMSSQLEQLATTILNSDVIGDLVEPLEQFTKVFKQDTQSSLSKA